MRVGIIGIAGRMGRLLCEEAQAIGAEPAGLLRPGSTATPPEGATLLPDLATLAAQSDVVIDFTTAAAIPAHAETMAAAGIPWVLGTSGLSLEQEALVTRAAERIPVVYSTNFSPGITLLLELAARMAAALPAESYDAEIIDMHHRQKVDAPSGTAVLLGRAVAEGRRVVLEDVMQSGRNGHTGPREPGAIGFAALRGGQVVGEHTLLFASGSEHVALTHRAYDRRIFATGAIRAARWVQNRPPGLYAMRDVMA